MNLKLKKRGQSGAQILYNLYIGSVDPDILVSAVDGKKNDPHKNKYSLIITKEIQSGGDIESRIFSRNFNRGTKLNSNDIAKNVIIAFKEFFSKEENKNVEEWILYLLDKTWQIKEITPDDADFLRLLIKTAFREH